MTDHDLNASTPDQPEDDRLDPRLATAARDYHRPPATPRDAMWARIEAARAQRAPATSVAAPVETPIVPSVVAAATPVVSLDVERRRRRPARTWMLLAGTLAAGLVIGVLGQRTVGGPGTPWGETAGTTARTTLGTAPVIVATQAPARADSTRVDTRASTAPMARIDEPTAPRVAAVDRLRDLTPRGELPRVASPPRGADRVGTLYHMAAVQTLTQAEALLTAWRVDAPREGEVADSATRAATAQLGTWARDVLSSTRLLLDSPAARDPGLRRLLDDLELVLAQIVQRSGMPVNAAERELIDRSLRTHDLLPRLRTAVPSGAAVQG